MAISLMTNANLAFGRTVVKFDQFTQSRVFLVRWCEFIPLAGLMTFLCDAVDMPSSKRALKIAVIFSLSQSASCIAGPIFPYCRNLLTWGVVMFFSLITYFPVFVRTWMKRKIMVATRRGSSFLEMERYNRHRFSYELMLLCSIVWSLLVVMYFFNLYVHVMLPEGHLLRHESLAMIIDTTFDVVAKAAYMKQILDTHMAVFNVEGLAHRQLSELRRLMSVLWGSTSDTLVLSVRHELKCFSMLSPSYIQLLGLEIDNQSDLALVIELERGETDSNPQDASLGIVKRAYKVDFSEFNFESLVGSSEGIYVDPESYVATMASRLVFASWHHSTGLEATAPPVTTTNMKLKDGTERSFEIKTVPHAENALITVVRDVTERYRRFNAELKAESETLARQRDAEVVRKVLHETIRTAFNVTHIKLCFLQQTQFVRHEIKNSLLVGIELIDSLRNAVDDVKDSSSLSDLSRPSKKINTWWKRIEELDSTLHVVLDTVLVEAMIRDITHGVYRPQFETLNILSLLRSTEPDASKFPVIPPTTGIPFLSFDPHLLRYIHKCAISNACKYGQKDGIVVTDVSFDEKDSIFTMKVINQPGVGHNKLVALGSKASEKVFAEGSNLHRGLKIDDQFVSSGTSAWIAQKCACLLGGKCDIKFEEESTVFTFICRVKYLEHVGGSDGASDFLVPPDTFGIAVDDSNVQRKLMRKLFSYVGIDESRQTTVGRNTAEIFGLERIIADTLIAHPTSKILVFMDENLDFTAGTGENVIMSGSRVMKDVLSSLSRDQERRIFALVRSANDSATDIAGYMSRTHGFFPKAPMNQDRARETLAPLWIQRFASPEDAANKSQSDVDSLSEESLDENTLMKQELERSINTIDKQIRKAALRGDTPGKSGSRRIVDRSLHSLKGDLMVIETVDPEVIEKVVETLAELRKTCSDPDSSEDILLDTEFEETWNGVKQSINEIIELL